VKLLVPSALEDRVHGLTSRARIRILRRPRRPLRRCNDCEIREAVLNSSDGRSRGVLFDIRKRNPSGVERPSVMTALLSLQICEVYGMCDRAASKKAVPIHAVLIGSDQCEALGITVCDAAPVLGLCRALVAAGHDPELPLHAHRGDVLALRVRTIGEAAQLSIAGDGVGFRRRTKPGEASPERSIKRAPSHLEQERKG
jgi:hypothetical protein